MLLTTKQRIIQQKPAFLPRSVCLNRLRNIGACYCTNKTRQLYRTPNQDGTLHLCMMWQRPPSRHLTSTSPWGGRGRKFPAALINGSLWCYILPLSAHNGMFTSKKHSLLVHVVLCHRSDNVIIRIRNTERWCLRWTHCPIYRTIHDSTLRNRLISAECWLSSMWLYNR